MSGPLLCGFGDYEGEILERLVCHPRLLKDDIFIRYSSAVRSGNSAEIIRLGGLFEKRVFQPTMIRRNEGSLWFKEPALKLPDKKVIDIATALSNIFEKEIKRLNKERLVKLNRFIIVFNGKLKSEQKPRIFLTTKKFVEHSRTLKYITVYSYIIVMLKKG